MAKRERIACHVADAGCWDSDEETANQRMTPCWRCGEPTCKRCSKRRLVSGGYGMQKICHDCASHMDGNEDQRTYAAYKNAGYHVTKSWVIALRTYKPLNEIYPYPERETLKAQVARWKREFEAR